MNILIPMAGEGRRFVLSGFEVPKPMIDVLGKPMIQWAVDTLGLCGHYIFITKKQHAVYGLKRVLTTVYPGCDIIDIDYTTEGAACTCLLAKRFIDNEDELVIANCDQIMRWDGAKFMDYINNSTDLDGAVVTYTAVTDKNSYVRLNDEGVAVEFAEKKVISEESLNGIHYWRKGSYFVSSAESMIAADDRVNNEFYIAPTYNYLLNDKCIGAYHIDSRSHCAIGTPADLYNFVNSELTYA